VYLVYLLFIYLFIDYQNWFTFGTTKFVGITRTEMLIDHAHNRPHGPKGIPGRLRPRILLTFGITRVVGRQPHAPAAFTPSGIPWYSFLEAESTPGHMVPSVTPPGIDPETF
jgi:hypothetical protein